MSEASPATSPATGQPTETTPTQGTAPTQAQPDTSTAHSANAAASSSSSSPSPSPSPPPPPTQNPKRRVKLYKLSEDNQWSDQGTGFVSSTYDEETDMLYLTVTSEENGTVLLNTAVFNEDVYQRQQETLIMWSDPHTNEDLALSFQIKEGCTEIWLMIEEYRIRRGGLASPNSDNEQTEQQQHSGAASPLSTGSAGSPQDVNMGSGDISRRGSMLDLLDSDIDLPTPAIGNLPVVCSIITECAQDVRRTPLAAYVVKQDYVSRLLDVFDTCEDLESEEHLRQLFTIFKTLFLMNDIMLLEVLVSSKNIMHVIGALEYDPEIAPANRMKHRQYMSQNARFKEVVPFHDPATVAKIQQTYRLQYLKDVVLSRVLDDATTASLNSLVFYNHLEIITHIQNDEPFQLSLFARLCCSVPGSADRRDTLLLLQEILSLAKNLQPASGAQFFRDIKSRGLFDYLHLTLADPDVSTRLTTAEIIGITLVHDPALLRSFIFTQQPRLLLNEILARFFSDTDAGLMVLMSDILKALFDTDKIADLMDRDEFADFIYKSILPIAVSPLFKRKHKRSGSSTSTDTATESQADGSVPQMPDDFVNEDTVMTNICDVLGFCALRHGVRIRSFLLSNKTMNKILKLTSSNQVHIALAAIRFLRTVIGTKDEQLVAHTVKINAFRYVMDVFGRNKRYNLANSAIIELFDFIRRENVRPLVSHIAEEYGHLIKDIKYVNTFEKLLLRYEQNKEYESIPRAAESTREATPRNRGRDEASDEEYFKEGDSDEEAERPSVRRRLKLVEYDFDGDVDEGNDDTALPKRTTEAQEHDQKARTTITTLTEPPQSKGIDDTPPLAKKPRGPL